jgi:hypothetical protein
MVKNITCEVNKTIENLNFGKKKVSFLRCKHSFYEGVKSDFKYVIEAAYCIDNAYLNAIIHTMWFF